MVSTKEPPLLLRGIPVVVEATGLGLTARLADQEHWASQKRLFNKIHSKVLPDRSPSNAPLNFSLGFCGFAQWSTCVITKITVCKCFMRSALSRKCRTSLILHFHSRLYLCCCIEDYAFPLLVSTISLCMFFLKYWLAIYSHCIRHRHTTTLIFAHQKMFLWCRNWFRELKLKSERILLYAKTRDNERNANTVFSTKWCTSMRFIFTSYFIFQRRDARTQSRFQGGVTFVSYFVIARLSGRKNNRGTRF